jgi:hypothetical protein
MRKENRGRMRLTMSFGLSIGGIRKVASGLAAFGLIFSMFSNAFSTSTPDCCRGKMCPIHHKHAIPAKGTENSHMDCEHQEMGLQSCSMSCGRSDDAGIQMTAVFLLPDSNASVALVPVERASLNDLAISSDLVIRPLTPPPRFFSSR